MLKVTIDYSQIQGARDLFARFPERLQRYLKLAMDDSLHAVTKEIKDRVPVRTGNLRRSWNEDEPKPNASGVGYTGRVGSNAAYAAAVEFGFHGVEQVKAHTRRSVLGAVYEVRAHSRNANQPARPYARPGMEAAVPRIQSYHVDAVKQALAEGPGR